MTKRSANTQTHLTLDERKIIEQGIIKGASKTSIADTLGKDNSTIGKEIKLHRQMTYKCSLPLQCNNYKKCKHERKCTILCEDYVEFYCGRRDRSPGACNGCTSFNSCRFTKYRYFATNAFESYNKTLVASREGINQTEDSIKMIADVVVPLIKQGQSPYVVIQTHPELGICEKTLYNYIEQGYFTPYGLINLDLRRKVSRSISKAKKSQYKKREDRKYLEGRKYSDYKQYIQINPDAYVVQMDTVYNDVTNGPFVQTFKFVKDSISLMIGIYHESKTAEDMVKGINVLDKLLGEDLFNKYFEVILTDRGGEFVTANEIEFRQNGTQRCRVFYCDPMASNQKGSLENNHEELRYILPKETDLKALGLDSQESLNLAISHINSTPKQKLEGKSPIELCEFLHEELMNKLKDFGIMKIPTDKIILKPYLLKK